MNDRKECLIRTCDGCGVVTAFDVDNIPEHKADMEMDGQTITEVTMSGLRSIQERGNIGPCRCSVSASKARIKALEDAAKWRPIESAPKDGTIILISGYVGNRPESGERFVVSAMWWDESGGWKDDALSTDFYPPTHWMPLPNPPQEGGAS
jgi:hypothetical protein